MTSNFNNFLNQWFFWREKLNEKMITESDSRITKLLTHQQFE